MSEVQGSASRSAAMYQQMVGRVLRPQSKPLVSEVRGSLRLWQGVSVNRDGDVGIVTDLHDDGTVTVDTECNIYEHWTVDNFTPLDGSGRAMITLEDLK